MISNLLEKTLKIYKDELKAFFWMAGLLFVIKAAGILLENYAEAAFLKRYGVQYLPNIFLINSILLFFVLTYIGLLIDKYERASLLIKLFIILGISIVFLRLLIIFNLAIVYPVLYLISFQLKNILDIVFWIIASSLFNTRQAKRVFPGIISGGILGIIIGSLLTSPLARVITMDNILFISGFSLFLGCFIILRVKKILAPIMQTHTTTIRKKTEDISSIKKLGEILPLIKSSPLLRVFIILVMTPAILLPIFNYQWGVITNRAFDTEGGLIAFYGYFKGIYNILTFFILFFIGRLFSRFGVTKLLFIHPVNYLFVFLALVFRFDLITAIYGRVSTNIFRSTTNRPALNMLMQLFSPDIRGRVSAFLKGTALRAGGLLGSGILITFKDILLPEQFSYIAIVFSIILIFACFSLKKRYSEILFKNLIETQIDLQKLGEIDFKRLIDEKTTKRLIEALNDPNDNVSILSAKILNRAGVNEDLTKIFLDAMPGKTPRVKRELLTLIASIGSNQYITGLLDMYKKEDAEVQPFIIRTIGKLDSKRNLEFLFKLTDSENLTVKKEAITAVYLSKDKTRCENCHQIIREMLMSKDDRQVKTAIDILRETKDRSFVPFLIENLDNELIELRISAIKAMGELKYREATDKLFHLLEDKNSQVRKTTVQALGKIWSEDESRGSSQ